MHTDTATTTAAEIRKALEQAQRACRDAMLAVAAILGGRWHTMDAEERVALCRDLGVAWRDAPALVRLHGLHDRYAEAMDHYDGTEVVGMGACTTPHGALALVTRLLRDIGEIAPRAPRKTAKERIYEAVKVATTPLHAQIEALRAAKSALEEERAEMRAEMDAMRAEMAEIRTMLAATAPGKRGPAKPRKDPRNDPLSADWRPRVWSPDDIVQSKAEAAC